MAAGVTIAPMNVGAFRDRLNAIARRTLRPEQLQPVLKLDAEVTLRDLTVERTAFAIRVALYVAFALPLFFANLLFDYAKIRAVVEDRRSMIGALVASARFIRRQPIAAWGMYMLDAALFLLVIGLYYLVAPSATAPDLVAMVIGQGYITLRVAVRLQFVASQVSLFQGRLAHAGYVARPVPRWPDSPAAEAIGPQ